ncbi:toll/interleukin-1 receptor domain-containing protein [Clostridium estertheticum]|uniref:toll/interleukin-1 receptor domain-containing protein n=1 Tax=Clostridium estertheticum TaxID=238834 RepID=UPI001CF5873B|nr:toll/interleukin-1 receptor domain-containing protein [Clostridium estertheticum]MCB2352665.1 toll/interleukin-1 receptor domain-containing protein [Clostridium estertheticum]WAG39976.1 toll/interleukin-1 receptor domain-containing protein [Clostridium estertheticum]
MSYLTYDMLNNQKSIFEKKASINKSLTESYSAKPTIFLSHRHDDKNQIKSTIGFLIEQGVSSDEVYIDWLDSDMPPTTSTDTANKLKEKITDSKRFIVLATPESIKSIWIPWELGIADIRKGLSNIAILPLTNNTLEWKDREYYGIYNTIEKSNTGNWAVFQAGSRNNGVLLSTWITR